MYILSVNLHAFYNGRLHYEKGVGEWGEFTAAKTPLVLKARQAWLCHASYLEILVIQYRSHLLIFQQYVAIFLVQCIL